MVAATVVGSRYNDPMSIYWRDASLRDRILFRTKDFQSDECWPWPGRRDGRGYGVVNVDKRRMQAHRAAYEVLVGPIPEGMDLDHLCRNRACVNPAHLEPVPHAENMRRAFGDTCPKGHQDFAYYPRRDGKVVQRICRVCRREADNTPERRAKRAAYKRKMRGTG